MLNIVTLPTKREIRFFCGAIAFLLLLIYGHSLWNDFVFWDDTSLIFDNPISHGPSVHHIIQAFTTYDPDLYVPLTFVSFQVNYLFGGLSPFLYHLTNLLLHMGSSILVAWIVLQLTEKKFVAVVTALLFALHPINVEAVAWASARKDVLSSFFFLASLGSYLRWRESRTFNWYRTSLLGFLFGLLSKASILPLPFILLLCDWYRDRHIKRRDVLMVLPFFALSLIFGIVALFGKIGGTRSLWVKILLGMRATMLSLHHLLWPSGLSLIYPFDGSTSLTNPDLLMPMIVVLVITGIALIFRKKWPVLLFGWIWFLLLLAPSFLTVEKGQDLVSELFLTSDRYIYLAAIGIGLIFASVFNSLSRSYQRPAQILLLALLLSLSLLSFLRSLVWQNTETLLRDALLQNPESAIAHNNLGVYYDSLGQTDAALVEYQAAAKNGGTGDAWFNLGVALMHSKQSVEAIDAFTHAVALRPDYVLAQLNLGALLTDAGDTKGAVDHLLKAQALDPRNVTIYLNLGIALEKGNDVTDAIRAYERALALDPGNAFAAGRVKVLAKAGR